MTEEEDAREQEVDRVARGLVESLGLTWEFGIEVKTSYGTVFVPYHSEAIAKFSLRGYDGSDEPKLVRRMVSKWMESD